MSIVAWLFMGFLAGVIAKAIYPGHQGGGIFATTSLGIIGAFFGGSLAHLVEHGDLKVTSAISSISLSSLMISVIGAMIAIFLWSLMTGRRAT